MKMDKNPADKILPVIGLEIHVELDTQTKMFCRCLNRFGDPPNTNTCPVCIGLPGVLPVMNRRAVELAMKVGLALGCAVSNFTKWDRKSYYYPDLPKNYQISQYDMPLSHQGVLEVPLSDGSPKKIRIVRAHLEEDAGKNVHDNPTHTGVDLNRAGVPLLEIVSYPDMNSVEQVGAYARSMHRLVRWLGASQANMQMGHMRFEPNINLHITRDGRLFKTPIIEVKNLNSFKALEGAVAYEIDRQYRQWCEDSDFTLEKLGKQNRGFDDARGVTVFQREKEQAHDYRYFPEPDLVPVLVDITWCNQVSGQIGELPLARRNRYMESYNLSFKEADALTQDSPTGELLDSAVRLGAAPRRVANIMLGKLSAVANERGCCIAEVGLDPARLARLAIGIESGKINAGSMSQLTSLMLKCADDPEIIAAREGLIAITDSAAIQGWIDQVIAANSQVVDQIKQGGKKQAKVLGFLMGQVMKLSGGAANPAQAKKMLEEKLGSSGDPA